MIAAPNELPAGNSVTDGVSVSTKALTILLTNFELDCASGTTLFTRDLALELQRLGHEPVIYTKYAGLIARELRSAGIQVTDCLRRLRNTPDAIHGHHWLPTREVLRRFGAAPAIQICHDHSVFFDGALLDPRIRQYFGVSQVCIERLVREGVPRERIQLLHNFVDTSRFAIRSPLPLRPARALVFSNYAHTGTHLPAVAEACRQAGLTLEVMGRSAGRFEAHPELRLSRYDIVFAKAKAALEAMATGAAVILCDYGGAGPMVTPENFKQLRLMNFGFQALSSPLEPAPLLREIARYDPRDAARVCATVRQKAGLDTAAVFLCGVYRGIIDEPRNDDIQHRSRGTFAQHGQSMRARLLVTWMAMPERIRHLLKRVPGMRTLIAHFWRRRTSS